jgi:hypothetical protein
MSATAGEQTNSENREVKKNKKQRRRENELKRSRPEN